MSRRLRRTRPSKERLDAGDQLAGRERLGEVVVGSEFEPDDSVHLLPFGREEEDRKAGRLLVPAEPPQDLEAGKARQHDVQNEEVRRAGFDPCQGGASFQDVDGAEPFGLQVVPDQLGDVRVVFHEKNRRHGR